MKYYQLRVIENIIINKQTNENGYIGFSFCLWKKNVLEKISMNKYLSN